MLTPFISSVSPSLIGAIFEKATEMRAQGVDLVDLSVGEPSFDTPAHVQQAAREAMARGETRYTAADGTSELKDAIIAKFQRDNGLSFARENIVVGSGAKQVLAAAMQVVLSPDDEVIIPAPCWTSHMGMVEVFGARPVIVPTGIETGFRLDAASLNAAITPRTKMLVLTSPGNPTGAVYGRDDLEALVGVLRAHAEVLILSDDLYEKIVFAPAKFRTLAAIAPDLQERILTINGVSKAYAMTGWRIGYGAGPEWWMQGIRTLFSQISGGPCSISQAAAVSALNGPQEFLGDWCKHYRANRDIVMGSLSNHPLLDVRPPDGAFYVLVGCAAAFGRATPPGNVLTSATQLSEYLLDHGVVTVPGTAFAADPFFRVSIAASAETVTQGAARICAALDLLT